MMRFSNLTLRNLLIAVHDALATARYRAAFERLGLHDERYVYEPVGAAFFFAQRLREDAVVLVAGLMVGMVVGLTGSYASEWSLMSMYLLFIAVVTFRSRGLFGKKSVLDV